MVICEDDSSFYLAAFKDGDLIIEVSGEEITVISTMERDVGNFTKAYIDLKISESLGEYNSVFVGDFVESYPIEKENKKDLISELRFFSFVINSSNCTVSQYHKIDYGRVHSSLLCFDQVNESVVSEDGYKQTIRERIKKYIENMKSSGTANIKFIKVDKYSLNITELND